MPSPDEHTRRPQHGSSCGAQGTSRASDKGAASADSGSTSGAGGTPGSSPGSGSGVDSGPGSPLGTTVGSGLGSFGVVVMPGGTRPVRRNARRRDSPSIPAGRGRDHHEQGQSACSVGASHMPRPV